MSNTGFAYQKEFYLFVVAIFFLYLHHLPFSLTKRLFVWQTKVKKKSGRYPRCWITNLNTLRKLRELCWFTWRACVERSVIKNYACRFHLVTQNVYEARHSVRVCVFFSYHFSSWKTNKTFVFCLVVSKLFNKLRILNAFLYSVYIEIGMPFGLFVESR